MYGSKYAGKYDQRKCVGSDIWSQLEKKYWAFILYQVKIDVLSLRSDMSIQIVVNCLHHIDYCHGSYIVEH